MFSNRYPPYRFYRRGGVSKNIKWVGYIKMRVPPIGPHSGKLRESSTPRVCFYREGWGVENTKYPLMTSSRESANRRRDERNMKIEPRKPSGSRRDTKKWCRGVVGREHELEARPYNHTPGSFFQGWQILACITKGAGRKMATTTHPHGLGKRSQSQIGQNDAGAGIDNCGYCSLQSLSLAAALAHS